MRQRLSTTSLKWQRYMTFTLPHQHIFTDISIFVDFLTVHAASFSYCLSVQLFAFFLYFPFRKGWCIRYPCRLSCVYTVQISSFKRPPVRVWRYSFCENFVSFIFLRKLSSHLHTSVIFFRRKTYLSTVRESIALLNTTGTCYIFPFLRKIISYFSSQIDKEKDNWNPVLHSAQFLHLWCRIINIIMSYFFKW